jgi:tetratricopeptide (TPR) repeat protein
MAEHVSLMRDLGLLTHAPGGRHLARELIAATVDPGPHQHSGSAEKALKDLSAGRPWLAIRRLRAIARRHPALPDLQYVLALALDMAGARRMAIDQYRRVLALCPAHPYALCHLAIILEAEGAFAEALAAYRHALAVLPERVRLRAYLAQFLIDNLDGDAALEALGPALPLLGDDPAIQFLWGQALALAQRFEESEVALTGALRALTEAPEFRVASRTPSRTPSENIASSEFRAALIATVNCLDRAGLVAGIAYGTLLGLVRDLGFIPHDTDIDFTIDAAVSPEDLCAAFAGDPDFVLWPFRDLGPHAEHRVVITFFYRSMAIDFFRMFPDPEAPAFVWCGLVAGGRLLRFQHQRFALARQAFGGTEVWVPAKPEQFLVEAYGSNWTAPDPCFPLWAAPNLMGDFAQTGRTLAITSIFLAVFHRDLEKAIRYCEHARLLSRNDTLFEDLERRLLDTINHPGCSGDGFRQVHRRACGCFVCEHAVPQTARAECGPAVPACAPDCTG